MLVVGGMGVSADAGYVLSLSGPATAMPGENIIVTATLVSDAEDQHVSSIWDAVVDGPRPLVYNGYLLGGNVLYDTGSPDDFSVPKARPENISTPEVELGTFLAPVDIVPSLAPQPGANAHLEAITRSGMTFGSGTLATLNLTVPAGAQLGELFTITPVPDTFGTADFGTIDTTSGGPYRFTVVPEPVTLALLALGGLFSARRRFSA
jgi:hypothetical protein